MVDTSVRKTWELDHSQFKIANPRWQDYLDSLVTNVKEALGIKGVRAEPYKLLLYEEGSFFKRHKDSEKVPGMVGTLVVCLPSKHTGGNVHLSHAGKNYIFETDKTSDFGLTSLAWFSDVTHEIKPLQSGYRLVITYNLIHTGGMRVSASIVGKQSMQLQALLTEWKKKLPSLQKLVYKLDHKYTNLSLSLNNLKGRDRSVCQALHEVGLDSGFCICFAEMLRVQSDNQYYGHDDGEESTTLKDVKTYDGCSLTSYAEVEEDEILGSRLWNRRPDSEDEGEFTGNESMPSTLRYHDTVSAPTTRIYIPFCMMT